jgi:nicotinate phosphoribosyltransferase
MYHTPLLTDLYQLTMAQAYWKSGMASHDAVFHLTFRKPPFSCGYVIACGLQTAIEYLEDFRFSQDDCEYLSNLKGADGTALFAAEFIEYLCALRFTCSVHAVPEGTIVLPHEPLLRVTGPIIEAQLVETALLNIVNFQTLIATKAHCVCEAAGDDPVLEFGLRRAQGPDGGVSASRAAYIGGCAATSNVLAGKLFSIPVRGTHAHSWVMAFENECDAFNAYAGTSPNNCVLLVDTYDTVEGVRRAIRTGKRLREKGHDLQGIRLDSGDLAELSKAARSLLNDAGFTKTQIVASSDLDEHEIRRLKAAGARIDVWGVGTRLATAYDHPALGGVYKLAAIRPDHKSLWVHKIKRSDTPEKTSLPGIHQVRRYYDGDIPVRDHLYSEDFGPGDPAEGITRCGGRLTMPTWTRYEELLQLAFDGQRGTELVGSTAVARAHRMAQVASFKASTSYHPQSRSLFYYVQLEATLSRELAVRAPQVVTGTPELDLYV